MRSSVYFACLSKGVLAVWTLRGQRLLRRERDTDAVWQVEVHRGEPSSFRLSVFMSSYVTFPLPLNILHVCNRVMNSRGHQRQGMILLGCRNEQKPLRRWRYCCHRDGKIKPADYKSLNWICTPNNKRCTDNRWEGILKMKTRVGRYLPLSEDSLKGLHIQ